jgi:Tfp pilus assembly protein PilO
MPNNSIPRYVPNNQNQYLKNMAKPNLYRWVEKHQILFMILSILLLAGAGYLIYYFVAKKKQGFEVQQQKEEQQKQQKQQKDGFHGRYHS